MSHALYARIDGVWYIAPWDDGRGGDYEPLQGEGLEWFEEALKNSWPVRDGDGTPPEFLLGEIEGGLTLELRDVWIREVAVRRRRLAGGVLSLTAPTLGEATAPHLELAPTDDIPIGWLNSLACDKSVRLGLAQVDKATVLVWLSPGGMEAWRADRIEADAQRRARQMRRQEMRQAQDEQAAREERAEEIRSRPEFINPYSFVPLPATVHRGAPRGHTSMGTDGFSGWFDWVLTLRTPMLLPRDQQAVHNKMFEYPGSSLRGALRSLHETLAGGCMRVLDDEYVPVHREPMNAYKSACDRLGVVRALDPVTHAVTGLEVASQVHWVLFDAFPHAWKGHLYSGRTLHVDASCAKPNKDRRRSEIVDPGAVSPGTDWVMHITDANPRGGHPYWVAVGKLGGPHTRVPKDTWEGFVAASEGSSDLVGEAAPPRTATTVPNGPGWPGQFVMHQRHKKKHPRDPMPSKVRIGHRRKSDGWLGVGDTVWLTGTGELKMAAIWRKHGEHPVRDRVAAALLPCSDPSDLCPTCSVFGSVRQDRSDDHDQAGYRTHICVGWAHTVNPEVIDDEQAISTTTVGLPPLRSPKPSFGGFYLEAPEARFRSSSTREDHVPRSHWGGPPDTNGPRRIRGRKYYWHGQVANGRQQPLPVQDAETQTVPAGTVLRARTTFDNLDVEQLGWLLAAADPGCLFDAECVIHLGGGKPLGYGATAPRIENLRISTAEDRYAGGTTKMTSEAALDHVRGLVEPRGLSQGHQALRRLLGPSTVEAEWINYPTTAPFTERGTPKFAKSFEWFASHSGARKGNLVPLPEATADSQYLDGRPQ